MNNIKRSSIILIIVICSVILGTTISFAKTGTVNVDQVVVRKGPSISTEVVTGINNGIEIEILGEEEGFYKIKYNNQEGYVRADLLTVKEEQQSNTTSENTVTTNTTAETAVDNTKTEDNTVIQENTTTEEETNTVIQEYPKEMTLTNSIRIYVLPIISSTVTTTIETGNNIVVNKVLNNWSYITFQNITGWVRNFNLTNSITIENQEGQNESKENTPEFTTGYINASSANIRETPSKSANIVTTISRNTEVKIESLTDEWYKVTYGELKGYISKKLISNTQTETTSRQEDNRDEVTVETKDAYVYVGVANIRETPSTSSKIVETLRRKAKIQIVGEEGEFYKIILENGKTAYVAKRLIVNSLDEIIEIPEVATEASNNTVVTSMVGSPSGEGVVAFAKQYLGCSYVYGGTSPEGGFDCSGFTSYVFSSCGYSLSRSCSTQAGQGISIEKSDLQLGDLLLFNNTSSGAIGHVGIYIGDGRFIHAANPTRGVVTDTINSGYYYTYYYGARRIV